MGRPTVCSDIHDSILQRRTSLHFLLSNSLLQQTLKCGFVKQTSHGAYYVATQMALAHNGILRGLNSIYIQAPNIPREDLTTVADFLTYCQCWSESMHHHHDCEEELFFPDIDKVSGVPGLMETNREQHRSFTPGFESFQEYAKTCAPKDYDGQKLRNLVEDFAEPLTKHLHDEVGTLHALDKYDSESVRQAYKRLEKALMATDNVRWGADFVLGSFFGV